MPSVKGAKAKRIANTLTLQEQTIADLKEEAIKYYRQLPVKKLAAAKVGRSFDAFNEWEKNDANFASRLQKARADWAVEQASHAKMTPQFLLERILKETFGNNLDITSKGEKVIPIISIDRAIHRDNSDAEGQTTPEEN